MDKISWLKTTAILGDIYSKSCTSPQCFLSNILGAIPLFPLLTERLYKTLNTNAAKKDKNRYNKTIVHDVRL